MSLSSNALSAKAKAMYGNRLKQDSYEELIKKMTLGDMVTYLKSQTSYHHALDDINVRNVHRGQLEMALNKAYFENCARLIKYAPRKNQEFYLYEIVGIEINLIMDKVVSLITKQAYRVDLSIPNYLANKTSFNIYGLMNIDNIQDLVSYLKNTRYYKILKEFDFHPPIDMNSLEMQLQKLYYQNAIQVIEKYYKGRTKTDLLNILYTSIELKNITKIYRLKKYFHESEEIIRSSLYLEYSRLSKDMINRLIQAKTAQEVLTLLSDSKYQFYLDDREYPYIEYYAENVRYNIAKRYMRFSNDAPLVYMTYCICQHIEIDNLKHIIEGIRYNKDSSTIEESLIYA